MGFSSVGVMANSLLLRVRLSSKQASQADTRREPQKAISDGPSETTDEAEKNYSSKWRSTWVVRILDHVHSFIHDDLDTIW